MPRNLLGKSHRLDRRTLFVGTCVAHFIAIAGLVVQLATLVLQLAFWCLAYAPGDFDRASFTRHLAMTAHYIVLLAPSTLLLMFQRQEGAPGRGGEK